MVACAKIPIINLKSDGSIILNGNSIEIEDLEFQISSSEVLIRTDKTLSYERLILVMKELDRIGVKKVGLKAIDKEL